jgi:predicted Zn-dependent peptidase
VEEALARAFGNLPRDPELAVGPHPREERLVIDDAVNAPRVLYGWIGPGEGEPGEASLRVAMEILAGPRIARLTKALVTEAEVAAEVKGRLEPGPLASVAALEIAPAPGRDAAQVEQRLDAELSALAADGPTWNELSLAKILLKHQIERELARVQGKAVTGGSAAPVSGARLREALSPGSLERLGAALEEVSPTTVRNAVRRTFDRRHRVVVVTTKAAQATQATPPRSQ